MISKSKTIIFKDNESSLDSEKEKEIVKGAMIRTIIVHFKNLYPGIFKSCKIFILFIIMRFHLYNKRSNQVQQLQHQISLLQLPECLLMALLVPKSY